MPVKKISLVTGGAGFIGSNYVKHLLNGSLRGVSKITILDKLTYAGTRSNFENLDVDSVMYIDYPKSWVLEPANYQPRINLNLS